VLGAIDLDEIDAALVASPDDGAALNAAWSRAALPDADEGNSALGPAVDPA